MSRLDWKRPSDFSADDNRRRVAVELSYDGSAFCGWQSQENGMSVQQTVCDAAKILTGQQNIVVCGSGRTDSKVHALGQVAHIEMDNCTIPSKAFCAGLNAFLPKTVRVRKAWDVDSSFHARFSAMAREYRYFYKRQVNKTPFTENYVAVVKEFPDIDLLNGYAQALIGTHDFTTFACSKDECPSKVRDIYESVFFYSQDMYGDDLLCYKICGNAFLYRMVRSLVGTMMEMGLKKDSVQKFTEILDAKDRMQCGKTADSEGLYLWRVSYDPNEYLWFEEKYGRTEN